jgi:hypothetical protein
VGIKGDETWVSFMSAKSKEQSKQWMNTAEKVLTNCLQPESQCELFSGLKTQVLMVEFMPQRTKRTAKH